jgi:hypothetical protein
LISTASVSKAGEEISPFVFEVTDNSDVFFGLAFLVGFRAGISCRGGIVGFRIDLGGTAAIDWSTLALNCLRFATII